MTNIVVVQSSLRKEARTAVVTDLVVKYLNSLNVDHSYLDLRDYDLPFCDGRSFSDYIEEYPDVKVIQEIMDNAEGFIFGYPNYVYTFSGVFKNFIDLFGKTTVDKYYGIAVNAGGRNGYMASNDLISIMLYDFNATAVMPQVYTARGDFNRVDERWTLEASKPLEKIEQMVDTLLGKINEQIILT